MYPRSRGKGTPLGGSSTDPDAPSFNDSASGVNMTNSTEVASNSTAASPTAQQQQQQQVRPRRSPQLPYPISGNITVNLPGRNDAAFYAPSSPHQMPPPPPVMQAGAYYDNGNVGGGPAPYYGSNNANAGHGFLPRGAAPGYDQPPPPPPPPPPPGNYDGDMGSVHDNYVSTPTSPPSFTVAGNAANTYAPFSHHSRTSSSNNNAMGGMMGGGADRTVPNTGASAMAGGDYRPPPVYGDLPLGGPVNNVMANNGPSSTNSGNSSFSRVGPSGSGHVSTPGSARLPPYIAGPSTGGAPPGIAGMGPNAPSSFSNRPYEGVSANGSQGPSTPSAVVRPPRGALGLKISAGGNTTMVPNAVPESPLLSSPLQNAQGNPRVAAAGNRTPPVVNEAGSVSASSKAESEAETSTSALKPTVEQAEARYQYLYEEFRKMSRVRGKLAEDVERLKRELTAAGEEVQYYRQKTLTAAEEREAIVHDYNCDVHYLLRLVDALASDVLAAHKRSTSAAHAEKAEKVVEEAAAKAPPVPSTPQLAIDVAASRLATMGQRDSAFAAAAVSPDSSVTMPPETPGLAEHLGLRHGVWMTRLSRPTSEAVVGEDVNVSGAAASERSLSGSASAPSSSLTPSQKQAVLLRDEMRDVHRSTHAAMSSYMTSLDYGGAPVAASTMNTQRGYPAGPQAMRRAVNDRFSQRQFKSEYRGLHLHVDVPRFHAQSAPEVPTGIEQPLGQANDGASRVNTSTAQPYVPQRSRGTSGSK